MTSVNSTAYYQAGIKNFEEGNYMLAEGDFSKVQQNDSNFAKALDFIKICEKKRQSQKELIMRQRLTDKYKTRINFRHPLSKNKSRLASQNFVLYRTQFEETPDGTGSVVLQEV